MDGMGSVMLDKIMLDALNERGAKYGMTIEHEYHDWYAIRMVADLRYTSQFADFASAFTYYMDTLVDFEVQKARR